MDALPEDIAFEILQRVKSRVDKNSFSLTCKRLHRINNERRKHLRLCTIRVISNEQLSVLCRRFYNLEEVEISQRVRRCRSAEQLDDRGFYNLSISCPKLAYLYLNCDSLITDSGLNHLACCRNLCTLYLNHAPKVNGRGLLSVLVGCQKLRSLHIERCHNVASMEWLEYAGNLQRLEVLGIMCCRGIGEGDLVKFLNGLRNLRKLHFVPLPDLPENPLAVDPWQEQWILCDSMQEISLVRCIMGPGRGLACILGKCKSLEKIDIAMCCGLRDSDIMQMTSVSRNLRAIALTFPSDLPVIMVSDECLKAIALNCPKLDSFRLSFSPGKFPSFTQEGILGIIQRCPLREIALGNFHPFNDVGMTRLCSARYLELLELNRCQNVSNKGLELVVQFPRLSSLKLVKCLQLSDCGLKPLLGSGKLKLLEVNGCPKISAEGVGAAAETVRHLRCKSGDNFL